MLSVLQLKNNASWRVISPRNIIKTGVYKHIRHPMYLGGMLAIIGLLILFGSWVMFFIIFTMMFNFWLDRIDREEQLMLLCFGQEYADYMNKTKALIPLII